MKIFANLDELATAAGTELGPTDWLEVTQDRVNLFADATGDHQWIHVDPERAANGPFGGSEKPAAVIESVIRYVA